MQSSQPMLSLRISSSKRAWHHYPPSYQCKMGRAEHGKVPSKARDSRSPQTPQYAERRNRLSLYRSWPASSTSSCLRLLPLLLDSVHSTYSFLMFMRNALRIKPRSTQSELCAAPPVSSERSHDYQFSSPSSSIMHGWRFESRGKTYATTMVTPTRLISCNSTPTSSMTFCAASAWFKRVRRRTSLIKTRAVTPQTWMANESISCIG